MIKLMEKHWLGVMSVLSNLVNLDGSLDHLLRFIMSFIVFLTFAPDLLGSGLFFKFHFPSGCSEWILGCV